MNLQREITSNLNSIRELEIELKERYNDKEIFNKLTLHQKSLVFFVVKGNLNRAYRETEYFLSFLINYLTD